MKKIREKTTRRNITLLECLVYVAVIVAIMNLGGTYAFRLWRGYRRQEEFAGRAVEARIAGRNIKREIEESSSVVLDAGNGAEIIVNGSDAGTVFFLEESSLYRCVVEEGEVEGRKALLRDVETFSVEKKSEGSADFITVDIVFESGDEWGGPEPVFSFSAVTEEVGDVRKEP